MMGINKFLGKETSNKVAQFQKEKKGKSGPEVRKLEEQLLKPDKIPPYAGKQPPTSAKDPLSVRTVKMVLSNKDDLLLFKKYFPVLMYVEPCITKIDLLLDFLQELENGKIYYDKKTRQFTYPK